MSFMKKIIVLLVSAFALCAYSVFATNNDESASSHEDNSFVYCQFSLDHYAGTVTDAYTKDVQVRLNCAQSEDVAATVFVYVDGEVIASDVFKICKGQMKSEVRCIKCGSEYNGKKYTLKLQ